MKKLMNNPENLVVEMCKGFVLAHPELAFNESHKIISRKEKHQNVALISGGGSGHEPAHAGFVGAGMLDAAVCGDVFASPSQIQIYKALQQVATDKGVLMIIKNYSGDMMNFQNGAALATDDGIKVDYVKVADDIAVKDSLYTVGRRGVAGTVFVHKIAGAAASKGYELSRVKELAQKAADSVTSLGFAYTSCTVPAKGTPTFTLANDEMEYGVGIHGEPGIRREKILPSKKLAQRIVDDLFLDRPDLKEVAVLVNGFGTTPLQELYVFNHDVCQHLANKGIKIYRTFVGNYMTSIDMNGASVSLLALDDELKTYLDAEANTPAFKMDGSPALPLEFSNQNETAERTINTDVETHPEHAKISNEQFTIENMRYVVDVMSACIIKNEVPFCELDAHAGDGDFGMSVAKGFKQLKREWHQLVQADQMDDFLLNCSMIIMEHCGGASGPIWGSAFRAASKAIKGKNALNTADFADMLQAAVKGIQVTGERSFGRGAVVGDKTLIDALVPCADSWSANTDKSFKENFTLGAKAAVQGAENTKEIVARMGRAGTVGDRSLGYPDAGAHGLGVIFSDIAEHLK
ncbi:MULTISPECIES: dihydroxyacetone kinase subunit DhaK [Acinetobacter]|jgi:dihydroxyacetone kinase|uniref:Dihydroxyacetone kinase subunit DhaK n=1 Tax=Acinetobacter chengduensis TaxID=2420890 RepID=A0ABX9TUV9_9GAMM|nr:MULTISPECIES: dihydroxyacetone kinase subunit DhaK [Acinetobacter]MBI1450911.1 dihydroxyacetone kinase subunit DhaK [Acinetobacter sp. FL51]RKG41224.1 dihydroxyacetone kinase subunit DhaK [Acinetobacter sp. WCHAc060007]RLL21120.1 dihydroxyacetone kinase subunit DhaK [Acinetobacter chengduensis]